MKEERQEVNNDSQPNGLGNQEPESLPEYTYLNFFILILISFFKQIQYDL